MGVAWALGLPAGRSMSREVLERMLRGRSSGGFASGAEQLVVHVRSMVTRQTMGMLQGGSAWELGAGIVPGVGSLGTHGEGWELLGQKPWHSAPPLQQARTRPMLEDPEYRWKKDWSQEYAGQRSADKTAKAMAGSASCSSGAAPLEHLYEGVLAKLEQGKLEGVRRAGHKRRRGCMGPRGISSYKSLDRRMRWVQRRRR